MLKEAPQDPCCLPLCSPQPPILPSRLGAALKICLMREIKHVTAETISKWKFISPMGPLPDWSQRSPTPYHQP